jgi:NAD(P)-dependent dehydrogenase (short-subunit alcohol dehydrogenase family)
MARLDGRVAILTGGAKGIGRHYARALAAEGARLMIADIADGKEVAATLAREHGANSVESSITDVSDEGAVKALVARTMERFGKIDILVNNAAFQEHVQKFEDLTEEHFDRTLKTNLYGYFHMAKAAVPHMKPGGAIVMTGSVTGIAGNKHLLDYSMTKGGIHAFARSLAGHLIDRGIRVNVVAPGPVWTPLNPADRDAEQVASFGSQTPMKRAAQPEEIAPAFVFLAAPACSSYITGEILPIIGGYSGG